MVISELSASDRLLMASLTMATYPLIRPTVIFIPTSTRLVMIPTMLTLTMLLLLFI